jgi:integrase
MATIIETKSGNWKAVIRKARFGMRMKVKTFSRKADAEAWARKTESEIERSVWRDIGGADRMTLREALDKYSKEEAVKHRGVEMERAYIRVMKDEQLAKLTLDRISRRDVGAMRDRWKKQGYAIATINRRLTILHVMFECAKHSWGMESLENPIARMKLKGDVHRERRVSDSELNALCEASESNLLRSAAKLAIETAMRRGELCALQWSMIDLDMGVAKLPASVTKSARSRDIPLSPTAIEILCGLRPEHADPRSFVLGGLQAHSLTQALTRAARRGREKYLADCEASASVANQDFLNDLHFHDFRHEATSRLATIFNLHELMKIVGHSSSAMLQRYYHPRAEDFAQRLRDVAQGTANPTPHASSQG